MMIVDSFWTKYDFYMCMYICRKLEIWSTLKRSLLNVSINLIRFCFVIILVDFLIYFQNFYSIHVMVNLIWFSDQDHLIKLTSTWWSSQKIFQKLLDVRLILKRIQICFKFLYENSWYFHIFSVYLRWTRLNELFEELWYDNRKSDCPIFERFASFHDILNRFQNNWENYFITLSSRLLYSIHIHFLISSISQVSSCTNSASTTEFIPSILNLF